MVTDTNLLFRTIIKAENASTPLVELASSVLSLRQQVIRFLYAFCLRISERNLLRVLP